MNHIKEINHTAESPKEINVLQDYNRVRQHSEAICSTLRTEDYVVQPFEFVSRPKWRAEITIGDGIPTTTCIEANVHALTRYAALCQEVGIVPIMGLFAHCVEKVKSASNANESVKNRGALTQPHCDFFQFLYSHTTS